VTGRRVDYSFEAATPLFRYATPWADSRRARSSFSIHYRSPLTSRSAGTLVDNYSTTYTDNPDIRRRIRERLQKPGQPRHSIS